MTRPARSPLAWFVVLVLVGGCSVFGGGDADVAGAPSAVPVPTTDAPVEPTATATATPSPSASATADPSPSASATEEPEEAFPSADELAELGLAETCELAGEEFCVDTDGDLIPDFIEVEIGTDPRASDCALDACPGVELTGVGVEAVQSNTLVILDASGSMAGDAGGVTKMDAAKGAVAEYAIATPEFVDLGLMVYGHRGNNEASGMAESCAGIETFAEVGSFTFENAEATVGQFQATGFTPIGGSLDAAGPVLTAAAEADAAEGAGEVASRIVLVSDGIETCGGDPVASAAALAASGIQVVVDVIGFDLSDADRAALQEVAAVTGGAYYDAADAQALDAAFSELVAQQDAAFEALSCLIEAQASGENCVVDQAFSANNFLTTYSSEFFSSGEADRGRFIRDWGQALQDEVQAQRDDVTALIDTIEEFRTLAAEAQQRRSDGVAQKVSRSFTCPFGGPSTTTVQAATTTA